MSMTTEQMPSDDEDCVIKLKAEGKASKWTLSWIFFFFGQMCSWVVIHGNVIKRSAQSNKVN